jgi:hypothetical protein
VTANTDFDARRGEHIPVDLHQPLDLQVHNHSGDVMVRAVERMDVLIVADEQGHFGAGDGSTFVIDVDQNRIRIQSTPGHGAGWPGMGEDIDAFVGQITKAFRRGGAAPSVNVGKLRAQGRFVESDITVEIPRSMTGRIEIHNTSGDIQVDGCNGEIQVTTVSGDLRLLRAHGELMLRTASGDVTAEGGSGRLTAHTTSGDIRIDAIQIDTFHLQTANGDIGVDAMLGGGPFHAQTANGDVRLTLRQRAAGAEEGTTLAFRAVSGDAHVSPPFRKIDQRRWQLGEGNSGRLIEVMTVSGDLTVDVAPASSDFNPVPYRPTPPVDVPPAPRQPEPPVAPPAPIWPQSAQDAPSPVRPDAAPARGLGEAERLAVLEAVERGEIDIEEALRRLETTDISTSHSNE